MTRNWEEARHTDYRTRTEANPTGFRWPRAARRVEDDLVEILWDDGLVSTLLPDTKLRYHGLSWTPAELIADLGEFPSVGCNKCGAVDLPIIGHEPCPG
jgi:hypothetical protein